jgi:hypothetical protein
MVSQIELSPEVKRVGHRVGYGAAVVVNLAMLLVVQFILDWGWLDFLTPEFRALVPLISLMLLASILANLIYQFNDTTAVKSTGQILVNLISLFVSYQIYQVFPFDFSGYDFNWELTTRIVLILAMVGCGIGVLTEALKLGNGEAGNERRKYGNDLSTGA